MDITTVLNKIEEASRDFYREADVQVGKLKVTIGILGADEESSIQDYLSSEVKMAFIYKMKLETVVRSIRAIDGFRIDNLEFFETGEVIDGVPVKVERLKYIRDLVGKWGQAIIDRLFMAYAELASALERDINPDKTEQELVQELMAQAQVAQAATELMEEQQ
jgi:hypothetical protein